MDPNTNPYKEDPVPAPESLGRLTQAVIALLFALMAIYLAH
jgi:hypothetical protein